MILFLKLMSEGLFKSLTALFCMVLIYMEALLTFWHVGLALYTRIYGAQTSPSLNDCSEM